MLTTAQVADRLGIDTSRVRRLAARYNIGARLSDRVIVYTEEDVMEMQRHSTGVPGRPSRTQGMTGEQLIALLRAGQFDSVVKSIQNVWPMVEHGWDLTRWTVQSATGSVAFTRWDQPTNPDKVALQREIRELEGKIRHLQADSYHQPAVRAERDRMQNRVNKIGHLLAEMPDPDKVATEQILCMFADSSDRQWQTMVDESSTEDGIPRTVLYKADWVTDDMMLKNNQVPF